MNTTNTRRRVRATRARTTTESAFPLPRVTAPAPGEYDDYPGSVKYIATQFIDDLVQVKTSKKARKRLHFWYMLRHHYEKWKAGEYKDMAALEDSMDNLAGPIIALLPLIDHLYENTDENGN
jgi:hypothetical protein